ncbi:MAG: M36 family metallopeptidase, partial [Myxococcota bacterium]
MTASLVLPAALALLVAQAAPAAAELNPAALQLPDAAPAQVFRSPFWRAFDPSLDLASAVETRRFRFGKAQMLRGTPAWDGVPVEGADRWVVFQDGKASRWHRGGPLVPRNQFRLDEAEAMLAATQSVPTSLIRDATVERINGLARRVWVSRTDGLYAAYRVRVPTLSLRELSDVYVDGENGRILQRVPVARFADAPKAAKVFRYAPAPTGVDAAALVDVELPNLRPAEPGDYLRGDFVETFNCCKEYVCEDGSGNCELSAQRCARDDDTDPVVSELALPIPTENLPLPDNLNLGDVLYARTVFCAELPRARSTEAGWVETPVDATRTSNALAGLASEEDAFAEVQAYFSTMTFFLHMRDVLEDATWCLGGTSMQCDEAGLPLLGDDGEPVRPFHVSTNLLIPQLDVAGLAQQLFAGRGRSEADPILVEDFQRIDNAAFVPALSGSPVEVPEEFAALVEIFNRDFDSNLYFQGARDFAYDGDIVFHEFTHAVVHSYLPEFGSLWHDEQGANAESGALNEGWSDYFAASFTGDSATGEYGGAAVTGGELGLR